MKPFVTLRHQHFLFSSVMILAVILLWSGKPDDSEKIIRNYSDHLILTTEHSVESQKRLFQFQSISNEVLVVKLIPYKYRPYLNEFDPLPNELFTKEGYDNYLEFKLNPGDIQWREFTISPVNIWKMNIEVRISEGR